MRTREVKWMVEPLAALKKLPTRMSRFEGEPAWMSLEMLGHISFNI